MSVTISMPQLGETVTEGTILAWVKEVGEYVAEDDILEHIVNHLRCDFDQQYFASDLNALESFRWPREQADQA